MIGISVRLPNLIIRRRVASDGSGVPSEDIPQTGLILDLDFNDFSSVTSGGGTVSEVANQVTGASNGTAPTSGEEPILGESAPSGASALQFTNDVLEGTFDTAFDVDDSGNGMTLFGVASFDSGPYSFPPLISVSTDGTSSNGASIFGNNGNNTTRARKASASNDAVFPEFTGNYEVYIATYTGSLIEFWKDGGILRNGGDATNLIGVSEYVIGRFVDETDGNAKIMRVGVYNQVLGISDINSLGNALATQAGTTWTTAIT